MSIYLPFNKRANIPGTPKGSRLGIMDTKSEAERLISSSNKIAPKTSKVTAGHYYYFESINPFVCGAIFVVMTGFGLFIALTVNYKTRALLEKLKAEEKDENVTKDIELGDVNLSFEDSPKEVPPQNNIHYYDKYMFDLVYDDDILYQQNNLIKDSKIGFKHQKIFKNTNTSNITNSGTTLLTESNFLPEPSVRDDLSFASTPNMGTTEFENSIHFETVTLKDFTKIEKIYKNMICGGCKRDKETKTYSYEYINSVNKIDDYEPEINLKNFKNCPVKLNMQSFNSKEMAMNNIKVINHYLFQGNIPIKDNYTIEILLLKLITMLINATENGYCYQKKFCKGMQDFFNNGIINKYFFSINNYLLQDCLVSAFLDYFEGHCMFPYLGNTSFINYTYQITDGFQVDEIYNESFGMIITMFLNFHMLHDTNNGIYHDSLEISHNEYIGKKLNEFLDYFLNLIPNNDNTNDDTSYIVNQVINKLVQCVRIMEGQKNSQKVFLYLQSILKIYTKHQVCCLKKKNNAHITLNTDDQVYNAMMNVLNLFGNTSSLIIKVIKSFSLILEDEGFPESLRAKLDEVINKENKKTDKTPKFRKVKENNAPLYVQPGAWNI